MSDWDWDWLLKGSGLQPQDFMPAPVRKPPSPIPLSGDYSSAAQVPLSTYASPTALQSPNAPASLDNVTPTAEDVAKALESTEYGQDAATLVARMVARLGSGSPNVANGLEHTTQRYLGGPLAAGAAIAGTISDIHSGTSPLEAVVGNLARGGLVYGSGAGAGAVSDGFLAIPAMWAADNVLPPPDKIGHFGVGILGALEPFDPAYDPTAF